MLDFYEKRKIRNLLYSKFSIGILLLLAIWMSVAVFERFTVEREMANKRAEKEAELAAFKERAMVLEAKVDALHDERGIEEELRKRFDVAKEGEQVVVIVESERDAAIREIQPLPQPEKKPWWSWLAFWR